MAAAWIGVIGSAVFCGASAACQSAGFVLLTVANPVTSALRGLGFTTIREVAVTTHGALPAGMYLDTVNPIALLLVNILCYACIGGLLTVLACRRTCKTR